MTRIHPGTGLLIRRRLAAPPGLVFAAWTDPDRLARWMSPVGHAEAEVDLRVGGGLRIVMIGEGRRIEHIGEYLQIVPGRRLAFTWRSPYTSRGASRVTVTFRPIDDETELTVHHELLTPDEADSHRGGWGRMLDRLAEEIAP